MRWTTRLHYLIGLLAATFVLILAVTGLLLNHTDAVGLHAAPVGSSTLRAWYGIEAPEAEAGFEVNGVHVTSLGDDLYLDATRAARAPGELIGAVVQGKALVVGFPEHVILLTLDGRLIEGLPLPTAAVRIGRNHAGRAVIDTAGGVLQANLELTEWETAPSIGVAWSIPRPLPGDLAAKISADQLEHTLNWERVLLDLHSGRIFGGNGEIVMDLAALSLLILSASGVWSFYRRQRSNGGS